MAATAAAETVGEKGGAGMAAEKEGGKEERVAAMEGAGTAVEREAG